MQRKEHETSFGRTLDTFHKTSFTFSTTWKMMLEFIILYFALSSVVGIAEALLQLTNPGTVMVFNFLFVELLPVLITGLTFAVKQRYGNYQHVFSHTGKIMGRWIKTFLKDLWNHKVTIIVLVLGFFFIEDIAGVISSKFFLSGHTDAHVNDKLLITLMHRNGAMILATTFIAPFAEELFFRFWGTDLINHLITRLMHTHKISRVYIGLAMTLPIGLIEYSLAGRLLVTGLYLVAIGITVANHTNAGRKIANKFTNHHKAEWMFWYAAVISAIIFASFHMDGQSILTGLTYIATALTLQYIMHRTKSLTAPVMVHSISNLIVVGAKLLI